MNLHFLSENTNFYGIYRLLFEMDTDDTAMYEKGKEIMVKGITRFIKLEHVATHNAFTMSASATHQIGQFPFSSQISQHTYFYVRLILGWPKWPKSVGPTGTSAFPICFT